MMYNIHRNKEKKKCYSFLWEVACAYPKMGKCHPRCAYKYVLTKVCRPT